MELNQRRPQHRMVVEQGWVVMVVSLIFCTIRTTMMIPIDTRVENNGTSHETEYDFGCQFF
jgi:hypothetical protein